MGINWKEKFGNINRKKTALVIILVLIVTIGAVFGFEYFKSKQQEKIKAEEAQDEVIESVLMQNPDQGPTLKPSQYKIGIEYDKAMKDKKPVITLFYADWCRFCIGFMPTYQSLSNIYKDEYNFTKVNVEDPKHIQVVKDLRIMGYPTVYILDPKYDNRVLLSNAILGDMRELRVELDRYLRIRELLDKKK